MPYFVCPGCALRAYSAASESRCPSCDAPLRRENRLNPSIPRAESIRRGPAQRRRGGRCPMSASAALRLYAWSFVPRRKQRASAELHLRLVAPRMWAAPAARSNLAPRPTLGRSS
jgi:hypothetical protein